MNTIYSTAVNTATVRVEIIGAEAVVGTQQAWYQINFVTSGDFHAGYTQSNFTSDIRSAIPSSFTELFRMAEGYTAAFWSITTPSGYYQSGAQFGPCTDVDVSGTQIWQGAALTLRAPTSNPRLLGRVHWPFIIPTDLTDNRFNDSFATRMLPAATFYFSTFNVGGVSFTPCIWSRLHSTYTLVEAITIPRQISFLHKRRTKHSKHNYPISWPGLWPA